MKRCRSVSDGSPYRPWGILDEVCGRLSIARWDVVACVGPEERSVAAVVRLFKLGRLAKPFVLQVDDPPSRFSVAIASAQQLRQAELERTLGHEVKPDRYHLLTAAQSLVEYADTLCAEASENLIVDITSLPKRFFFALVKRLQRCARIQNLVVTYTYGDRHFKGPLAEDPAPAAHLPLFAPPYPEVSPQVMVVALGFHPLGLPEMLEERNAINEIRLLFPFPTDPANAHRVWGFLHSIGSSLPQSVQGRDPIFVPGHDASAVFDYLVSLTDGGVRPAVFAPFGPKPVSLAMCLFASLTETPVYYTQPRIYNPAYTTGVRLHRGTPLTYAYCIRLSGRNLFAIPAASAGLSLTST